MTEDITRDVIRPGGEKISKNAVPVTKHVAEKQVQPVVEQVRTEPPPSLTLLYVCMSGANILFIDFYCGVRG